MSRTLKAGIIISLFLICIFVFTLKKSETSSSLIDTSTYLYINFVDSSLNHKFYKYDIAQEKNKTLLKKDIKDYPTAAYYSPKNEVYFTDKVKNQTSQLFKKNLGTNKVTKLTDQFNHVDFLEMDQNNDLLFMRVLRDKDDLNFQIAIYDIKNKKIVNWDNKNTDTSIKMMDYSPEKEQLLVITNSVKEEQTKINKANQEGIFPEPPLYTISTYNTNGEKVKDVATIEVFLTGATISPDGKGILVSYHENPEKPSSKIAIIDLENQEQKVILQDSRKLSMIREPKYNKDKSGFYFLADIDKNVNIKDQKVKGVTINFYNFKDKEVSKIWFREDGEAVNFSVE
jgi:hypothetical protein